MLGTIAEEKESPVSVHWGVGLEDEIYSAQLLKQRVGLTATQLYLRVLKIFLM